VRDLDASYFTRWGRVRAVVGLTFSVREGECLALVGESGSGKTASALSILRMLPDPGRITHGSIRFEGEDLLARSEDQMASVRGRRIGLVPQDPSASLNPLMTAGEHVTELLDAHVGLRGGARRRRAIELLEAVGIPEPERRFDAYPHQLSGGMRQRVMIALAIACRPALLIADEPTTALDSTVQAQILELLASLGRELRMATILITHNLGIVAGVSDRVAVMYAGRIVEITSRDQLFAGPRHPYTRALFECVPRVDRITPGEFRSIPGQPPSLIGEAVGCAFTPRCALATASCREMTPPLLDALPGHGVACWNHDAAAATTHVTTGTRLQPTAAAATARPPRLDARQPLVELREVTKHFPVQRTSLLRGHRDVVHAVDGVDLAIDPGQTLGLVGESGCGKSTVGRLVTGLYRPTAGAVLFDRIDIATLPKDRLQALRRGFQIVFQDPFLSLNPRMTVGASIGEGLEIHRIGSPRERTARVAELMALVGLPGQDASRYPHEFSGGQRQRVAIARALAPEPRLVVLDEPVSSLDVSVQAQILRLLADLQARLGLTYLLIGHDLAVVGNMSQRVAVMYLGLIVEMADRRSLFERPLHPYTRALFSAVPIADPSVEGQRRRIVLEGEVPSPIDPPVGCRFAGRCPIVIDRCRVETPPLRAITTPGSPASHIAACHRAEEVAAGRFPSLGSA
jgi:peptide/nickel transport system ATP-binding protein